jgi:hypothetical protein
MGRIAKATYRDIPFWKYAGSGGVERARKEWLGMVEALTYWSNTLPHVVNALRQESPPRSMMREEYMEFLDEVSTLMLSWLAGINNALKVGGPQLTGRIYVKRITEYRKILNEMLEEVISGQTS